MTLSLMPTSQDLELPRKDKRQVIFKFSDPLVADLTNDKVWFTAYASLNGTVTIPEKLNGPGGTPHSNPTAAGGGETTFTIEVNDTISASNVSVTAWRYEVRRLPNGGTLGIDDVVAFQGNLIIEPRAKPD